MCQCYLKMHVVGEGSGASLWVLRHSLSLISRLLEKEMETHSSILAWRISWTEEPGGPQSMGSQTVGHDRATSLTHSLNSYIESESRSIMSDSLWCHGPYSPWNPPGQNTGVGSLSLLQGIFPTQGSYPGLPHCRQILYQLSHKGSLVAIKHLAKN